MAKIIWDEVGQRLYETGVSQGVLYKSDGLGVPWNGITSVDEQTGSSAEAVWFDGLKYNDIVTLGDFTASLKAFTYPDEFLEYEGTMEDQKGFFITNQLQRHFGLSFRTETANDITEDAGYKIHLLYNLLALPTQRSHQTLSMSNTPIEFEWTISSIPEDVENFRPTAHAIIDSRKMDEQLLVDIEDILYGDEDNPARLPPLSDFATFIRNWDRLVIVDLGNGMWEAHSPLEGIITMSDETTFSIISETVEYIDEDTYTISSDDKNEEGINRWQP